MGKLCDIIVPCSKPSIKGLGIKSVSKTLAEFKDLSSDPQLPRAKPGMGKGVCQSSTAEVEISRCLELASQQPA